MHTHTHTNTHTHKHTHAQICISVPKIANITVDLGLSEGAKPIRESPKVGVWEHSLPEAVWFWHYQNLRI